MPDYRKEAGQWLERRSWKTVLREFRAMLDRGEECAGYRVRTRIGSGDEARADQHAETKVLFGVPREAEEAASDVGGFHEDGKKERATISGAVPTSRGGHIPAEPLKAQGEVVTGGGRGESGGNSGREVPAGSRDDKQRAGREATSTSSTPKNAPAEEDAPGVPGVPDIVIPPPNGRRATAGLLVGIGAVAIGAVAIVGVWVAISGVGEGGGDIEPPPLEPPPLEPRPLESPPLESPPVQSPQLESSSPEPPSVEPPPLEPPPPVSSPSEPVPVGVRPVEAPPDQPPALEPSPLEPVPLRVRRVPSPLRPAALGPGATVNVAERVTEPPRRTRQVNPRYPEAARRARIQGDVKLRVKVDQHGDVEDVSVLNGLGMGLTEAAEKAVRQWKYQPAMRDGKPVAVDINVTVRFRL